MKKAITSIINRFKKWMEDYEDIYREACKDPNFMIMERCTFGGMGCYL